MKILRFGEKYGSPVTLALGFFDCVHIGHAAVIERARALAREIGCECAVFTFINDPAAYINKKPRLYTFEERVEALRGLGVDVVVAARFDEEFMHMSAEDFLALITDTLDVKAVTCGTDYTYGAEKRGTAETLKAALAAKGIATETVELLRETGHAQKISSTDIKSAVEEGDIERANSLLSEPYFMLGRVSHAHGRGATFGYPTANIPYEKDKLYPAQGVYATTVTLDGAKYAGGTNIGGKPTFGDSTPSVETFILDFDGDIYGKDIKLAFRKRLRGISDFGSAEGLARQLERDVAHIREIFSEDEK